MKTFFPKHALAALLIASSTLVATTAFADVTDFRVYDVQQDGQKLLIYHAFPASSEEEPTTLAFDSVEVKAPDDTVQCKIKPGQVDDFALLAKRGGDRSTTLFVMDRSHRSRGGGTTHVAVEKFLIDVITEDKFGGDTFAVVDIASAKAENKTMPPTRDIEKINAYFKDLDTSKDNDPEIFARTHDALDILDQSDHRISTVVLVSDGMTEAEDADAQIKALVDKANEKRVNISVVHIDRSTGKGRAQQDTTAGRLHLQSIQEGTGGLFASVQLSPFSYNGDLGAELRKLASVYGLMHKTICTICGDGAKNEDTKTSLTMELMREGEVIARSSSDPPAPYFKREALSEPTSCDAFIGGQTREDGDEIPPEPETKKNKTRPLLMILGAFLALIGVILAALSRFVGGGSRQAAGRNTTPISGESEKESEPQTPPEQKIKKPETKGPEASPPGGSGNSGTRTGGGPTTIDPPPRPVDRKNKATIRLVPSTGGRPHPLAEGETLFIGANSDNDVVISDPKVSGEHAMLTVTNGHVYITDLESTNGTFVLDSTSVGTRQKVRLSPNQEVHLLPGDEVVFGNAVTFKIEGASSSNKPSRKTRLE